jgi:hypothetical protein
MPDTPDPDATGQTDPDPPAPDADGTETAGETETDPTDVKKLKATLAAERRARVAAEREASKLRDEHATDADRAIAAAREEGRREALGQVSARMVDAEVRAAAAGRLADPADAVRLLEVASFVDDDTGEIDGPAIAAAIDDLIEQKPYLKTSPPANGSHPTPPAPQGTRPGPAVEADGDAFLRRVARGG